MYAPAAVTVIPQFSKSFSTPFLSNQLHQTAFIVKERILNRMPFTVKFEILLLNSK